MHIFKKIFFLLATSALCVVAAEKASVSVADMEDSALSQAEKEVVPLAEAMPAENYKFAPTQGAFQGVRTFGQQISHLAAVLDGLSAALLGEKPVDTGSLENGPASLNDKDSIVAYLKSSFEHAHRAMKMLDSTNLSQDVKLQWGNMRRLSVAELMVSHTFDHYGQAVVYARMNDVVPPASRH